MTRARVGIAALIALLAAVAAIVLVLEPSDGAASQVRGAYAQFTDGLGKHDPSRACDEMTPAFYDAFAGDYDTQLKIAALAALPSDNCVAGLRQLFELAGKQPLIKAGESLLDISVDGNTATAHTAPSKTPLRFVKTAGRWRIDCCIGRQLERRPRTTYRVPSGSMLPTLKLGQTVVSNNRILRTRAPAVNDIIVLHPPAGADVGGGDGMCGAAGEGEGTPRPCGKPTPRESGQLFIKRIVGLPGDRIAVVNGRVIRNGKPEPQPYRTERCDEPSVCDFRDAITVPAGEYFVLGDNRGESDDSRFWGPVKRSWIVGLVSP